MATSDERLLSLAHGVGKTLKASQLRLVLAESCTGGVIAAALTDVPGISEFFCGSAVTYRNETKAQWLSVSRDDLANPAIGAVSRQVAEQMCRGVLQSTPEADLAAAITGHLGPNSPPNLDGVVYICVLMRGESTPMIQRSTLKDEISPPRSVRYARQRQAAMLVLQTILELLES